jgi:hypothetical protein
MEVYVSINGVLRNLIQKFEYHYKNNFLDAEITVDEGETPFDYKITTPIKNNKLLNSFAFQSKEEFDNFLFVDFPLEIFGCSTLSYPMAIMDLNKLIYENENINFTVVGLDEYGKAKSSTLFFLSKYSYFGNNIRFIRSENIGKEWQRCDLWITDDEEIIKTCPKNKKVIKFKTDYNQFFEFHNEIDNLTKIELPCLKYLEETTISMSTRLLKLVARFIQTHRRQKKLNQ